MNTGEKSHKRHASASQSFEETLADITRPMSFPSYVFSKFIHIKSVEMISDIIGATIARPHAILLGAILSFSMTLITFILAKSLGYTLTGFESIAFFLLGWLLGNTYDLVKLMITGKN